MEVLQLVTKPSHCRVARAMVPPNLLSSSCASMGVRREALMGGTALLRFLALARSGDTSNS